MNPAIADKNTRPVGDRKGTARRAAMRFIGNAGSTGSGHDFKEHGFWETRTTGTGLWPGACFEGWYVCSIAEGGSSSFYRAVLARGNQSHRGVWWTRGSGAGNGTLPGSVWRTDRVIHPICFWKWWPVRVNNEPRELCAALVREASERMGSGLPPAEREGPVKHDVMW